ncbi:MAG: FprA family A-type flavoprotein, partial [Muribaculaceae bacterium]|nr:FprA family A-type flavoprotein [Muribaculaceae bacterium]
FMHNTAYDSLFILVGSEMFIIDRPYGVSYNSYLVNGSEKTVLIDTVELGSLPDFLHNLRQTGTHKIDYLVINHMEPDHSGSIPEIVKAFPELKIIGNRQTIGMVGGFYKITDPERFIEVKDGACIELGDLSLTFYMTPMVHWPETMMTYVKERGVLFSGDAFGTFGALNGGVTDCEMDTDWYWPEMYRYYSNIVGKYGVPVQRALGKLKGINLEYICSTHGPVWHEHIGKVIDIYDRLSRYEAEEGVVIVYGSMYGNTGVIAEALGRELTARGIRRIKIHNATHSSLSDMLADVFRYKGLVVGGPTYSMHLFPPIEQFMIAIETRELKNRVFGSFGSFSWASAVANGMQQYTNKMKMDSVGHIEMKHSADGAIFTAVASLADKIVAGLRADK